MTNIDYPWLLETESLLKQWATGNSPHAVLFLGHELVCYDMMQRFAQYHLCETKSACQQCKACRHIKDGTSPNVSIVGFEDEEKSIATDTIRALIAAQTLSSKQKQCVLINAHKLHANATNAFLKTLEEPQGNVCYLLSANTTERLLPTLVSRCVQCPLPNPTQEQGIAYLTQLGFDKDQAQQALQRFDGCALTAQHYLAPDQALWVEQVCRDFLALLNKKTDPVTLSEQWLKDSAPKALYLVHSLLSDLCLLTIHGHTIKNQACLDELTAIASQIDFKTASSWVQSWQNAMQALSEASANPKLVLEQFLIQLKR